MAESSENGKDFEDFDASGNSQRPPSGGYEDSLFLDTPPESLTCPVCLLVLKEPHLLSCCGAHLCQICIQHIKMESKPCPCCREKDYTTLLNKHMRGNVYSLKVRCSNQECDWKGELGGLQRHIDGSCRFAEAECRYGCGTRYPRHILAIHERDKCPKCPIEDRIEGLSCRLDDELTALEKKNDAAVAAIKDILKEQKGLIETLTKQHKESNEQMKKDVDKLRKELEEIKKSVKDGEMGNNTTDGRRKRSSTSDTTPTVTTLPTAPKTTPSQSHITTQSSDDPLVPPCVMIMDGYSSRKRDSTVWYSPPFLSSKEGYKFCLSVHASGDNTGKGTHISLYINLMKGPHDAALKWPFKGEFLIYLVNWREDKNHVSNVIKFDEFTPKEWSKRLYDVDRAVNGRGKHRLVVHSLLPYNPAKNTEYLNEDRLCFKVVEVKLY